MTLEEAINNYLEYSKYSYSYEEVLEEYDSKYKKQCYVSYSMKDIIENCVIPFEKGDYKEMTSRETTLSNEGKAQVIAEEREFIKKAIQEEIDLEKAKYGQEIKGTGYVLGLIKSMNIIDSLF
jgi:hypothetical protein